MGVEACEEVAIITTEIATNALKHAHDGEVHVSRLSQAGDAGVEVLSIDRGPGIANFQACLADGYSTAGTPGNGLGAIARLAHVVDMYSQPGKGTVLMARRFTSRPAEKREAWTFGGVTASFPGEPVCGDNWGVRRDPAGTTVIVADGLGHGVLAAEASAAAVRAFRSARDGQAVPVLREVHLALRSSRGAAVSVLRIEHRTRSARFAGLGNVAGVLVSVGRQQSMVSQNGTAGHEAHRLQEFDYAIPEDGTLVMHSDGVVSSWSLESYPGLLRRHPAVIAGVLYRDASRRRDDVCVVAGRYLKE
jgi:anti-sigma regulatory factor (Ser/Thr protein kinase)